MAGSTCRIDLDIDTSKHMLSATAEINYLDSTVISSGFYLCNTLAIQSLKIDGVKHNWEEINTGGPFRPSAKQVRFAEREFSEITVEYAGAIEGAVTNYNNYVGSDFVLLTDYGPWYPAILEQERYTIQTRITGLNGYSLVNSTLCEASRAVCANGRMILAFRNELICEIESDSLSYRVIYFDESESRAAELSIGLARECMEYYQHTLLNRQLPHQQMVFFRPKHPINTGWSFIRNGVTVCGTPLEEDELATASLVSHELAHTWSSGAPLDWEDWLNESFAEYAAMLFIGTRLGHKAYQQKLDQLLETNKTYYHQQPIKPLHGTKRPESVHTKGPIVFDELRSRFGIEAARMLIRTFDALPEKTTANLLQTLRENGENEIAAFLERKIQEPI